MKKWNKRIMYGIIFFLLLLTEILIALFLHDKFIRPYVGDALVVIVIYSFIRIFLPEGFSWMPLYIFIFSVLVEVLQWFQIVDYLGLGDNLFARIIIGSTFDIKDILCYAAGCLVLAGYERFLYKKSY